MRYTFKGIGVGDTVTLNEKGLEFADESITKHHRFKVLDINPNVKTCKSNNINCNCCNVFTLEKLNDVENIIRDEIELYSRVNEL
jgi:hypothetical protein